MDESKIETETAQKLADVIRRARRRTRRMIITVGSMVFLTIVALLTWDLIRTDQYGKLLDGRAEATYHNCLDRNINAVHYNDTADRLADIERTNRFVDEATRSARVQVYEDSKLILVNCEALNPHRK
jgi:hypothetical protein